MEGIIRAMVVCANKSITMRGPELLWCAIALAIPEDRSKNACMFIEDAGFNHSDLDNLEDNIVNSIIRCGENQSVLFKEIYVGHNTIEVLENEVGCALTCAPYITLAKNAIPSGYQPRDLLNISLNEWEKSLNIKPLEGKNELEGPVISDTVNIASRIESLTKMFGSNILISNDLFLELNSLESYNYRFIGLIDIKGKNQPISIFEIYDGDNNNIIDMKNITKNDFEKIKVKGIDNSTIKRIEYFNEIDANEELEELEEI
ncbi:histidine decarboxylase, pyruvoyl type [Thiospirochaeta perfilievii]|uniref:histidine decarboxylase, pyruvoyl type n=1 Tax=Thiospirochaeta perfilievii TaxID=252967 RepID=UPI001CA8CF4F|nr:histidine decarboxylase, pyruvoyl type [Thiospirochaeta perfilievii]